MESVPWWVLWKGRQRLSPYKTDTLDLCNQKAMKNASFVVKEITGIYFQRILRAVRSLFPKQDLLRQLRERKGHRSLPHGL
jgi:hypothetical protein